MADDIILARMRAARVQPHAFPSTLESINQKLLAKLVEDKRYTLGPGGLVSYLIAGKRKAKVSPSTVCHVFAKMLVIQGKKVFCTSIAELAHRGEMEEVTERMGTGYFVISDVSENTKNCSPFEWDSVQALLLSHVGRGGGLIIGSANFQEVEFGDDFLSALPAFEAIDVV